MKVVVTGGAGRIGQLAVLELQQAGHQVLAIDRVRPATLRCPFLQVELTEAAAVYDTLAGAEAVLHLGAIPGPTSQPPAVTFRDNVQGTYVVAEAAARLGVRRFVFASSIFAVGWAENPADFVPLYAPVDEAHPLMPHEAYGLSKQIGEDICAAVSRRTGMPTVSLRIMNTIHPDGYFALPWPTPTRDLPIRFVMWPYVDARDVARACRQAVEAPTQGHEPMFIAAADTRFEHPTMSLFEEFAPSTVIREVMPGCTTVVKLDRARQLIGYEPQFGLRNPG